MFYTYLYTTILWLFTVDYDLKEKHFFPNFQGNRTMFHIGILLLTEVGNLKF